MVDVTSAFSGSSAVILRLVAEQTSSTTTTVTVRFTTTIERASGFGYFAGTNSGNTSSVNIGEGAGTNVSANNFTYDFRGTTSNPPASRVYRIDRFSHTYTVSGTETRQVRASASQPQSGGIGSATTAFRTLTLTPSAPAIPSAPTNISASTNRSDGINISWAAATGATSYGIWWGPTPTSTSTPDFTVSSPSTSYLDDGAPVGSRKYWVRSQSDAGNSAYAPAAGVTGTRLVGLPVFSDTTVTGNWVVGKNYNTASDRTVAASDTDQYTILTSNPSINSFPHWISINNSGQLSGTPTASGTFTFRAQASGDGGTQPSSNITIVVHGALSWIDQTLANGIKGVPYSDRVEAQNATAYAISPAFNLSATGLSFNNLSGLIAGTPKEIASYTFTITASNPGDSLSKEFTISFKSGGRRMQDGVAVTIENKKRWDTSLNPAQWVDITTARRFNSGTNQWEEISN